MELSGDITVDSEDSELADIGFVNVMFHSYISGLSWVKATFHWLYELSPFQDMWGMIHEGTYILQVQLLDFCFLRYL